MKKIFIIAFCYLGLFFSIVIFLLINPFSSTLEASTVNQVHNIKELETTSHNISDKIDALQTNLSIYANALNDFEKRLTKIEQQTIELETYLTDYYIDKLSDPTYTDIYNEEYIYYTAAENLGQIGKPAIPKLISRLQTPDDYERALVLYALLLASQDDSVQAFAGNNYIDVNLDFDARNHPEKVKIAYNWWDKYKSYFK